MSIKTACPQCGKTYDLDDGLAGKKAKCKKCGEIMRIPAASNGPAVGLQSVATPQAAPGKPQGASQPAVPREGSVPNARTSVPVPPAAEEFGELQEDLFADLQSAGTRSGMGGSLPMERSPHSTSPLDASPLSTGPAVKRAKGPNRSSQPSSGNLSRLWMVLGGLAVVALVLTATSHLSEGMALASTLILGALGIAFVVGGYIWGLWRYGGVYNFNDPYVILVGLAYTIFRSAAAGPRRAICAGLLVFLPAAYCGKQYKEAHEVAMNQIMANPNAGAMQPIEQQHHQAWIEQAKAEAQRQSDARPTTPTGEVVTAETKLDVGDEIEVLDEQARWVRVFVTSVETNGVVGFSVNGGNYRGTRLRDQVRLVAKTQTPGEIPAHATGAESRGAPTNVAAADKAMGAPKVDRSAAVHGLAEKPNAPAVLATDALNPGDRLWIQWGSSWYPGAVVSVRPGGVEVSYDGWRMTEVVKHERLLYDR